MTTPPRGGGRLRWARGESVGQRGELSTALPRATSGRNHARCCHGGGADSGRHDLDSIALPSPAGEFSYHLPSCFACLPPHSRDGLPSLLGRGLGQATRQLSTATPRLPSGRPCVIHGQRSFLRYFRHVPF